MENQVNKLKTKFSLIKYKADDEVVLVFVENCGSRFITRTKIDKTVSNYLSDRDVLLPLLIQINLHKKLMKILGIFNYIFVNLFYNINFQYIYLFNRFTRWVWPKKKHGNS
jgi:hypothetical protein